MPVSPAKITVLFALPLFAMPAAASQRKHRPWLMIGGAHKRHSPKRLKVPASLHPSAPVAAPAASAPPAKNAPARVVTADPTMDKPTLDLNPRGEEVVHQAMKYQGSRYRFGGTTARGFDCSGLVSRVYADLKLKRIPRASDALYKAGKPVALADLRPGDLVFFKNTYRRGISHVGIYAGHNKFVHASNHRTGVTLTALSDPYYQLHYAGARRMY